MRGNDEAFANDDDEGDEDTLLGVALVVVLAFTSSVVAEKEVLSVDWAAVTVAAAADSSRRVKVKCICGRATA